MNWRDHPRSIRGMLVLASFLVGYGLLELGFRVAGIRPQHHRPPQNFLCFSGPQPLPRLRHAFHPLANARSEYDSNPRGYFDDRMGIDHVHNSAGWRDLEHPLAKPPGTFRILGLGDSYLWGQGVRREDVCLIRLEGILNERLAPHRFETINSGLFAMNTVMERDSLREQGLQYSPDLVIVHFVLNDVEEDVHRAGPKVEFFSDYTATYLRPDWLARHSHAWGWARQRWLKATKGRAYVQQAVRSFDEGSRQWLSCRQALIDIRDLCRQHGAGLLVVIFPFFHELNGDYPFQPIHDAVGRHCRAHNIPVLDLRDAYRAWNGPELWVHPTDQHPNEIAHGIAAEAIFHCLKANAARFLRITEGTDPGRR